MRTKQRGFRLRRMNKKGAPDVAKNIIIGSIFVLGVAFLMLLFAFNLAHNYGKDTTSFEQNTLNFSAVNKSLSNVQSRAESWKEAFANQNIFVAIAGIVVTGIFGIGIDMFNFVVGVFDLIFIQLFNNVLHVPPAVTAIGIAVLIISAIFGLWRLLRFGD